MAGDGRLIEAISQQTFDDMQKLIKQLGEVIKLVGTSAEEFKKIKLPSQVAKKQKETTNAIKSTNTAVSDYSKSLKTLANLQKKQLLLTTKIGKEQSKRRFEITQINKANKEEAILTSRLSTEYQKQQVKLTQLKKAYQGLALKKQLNGKLSKQEEIQLRRTKRALDRKNMALKKVDAQMGINNRHVGNYKRSLMGLGTSLMGAFGVVSGVMIFAQVMRSTIGIITKFDKANATLSAVLQVERDQMKGLIDDSKRLGAITAKTANEVVGLQIAYARLGFTQDDIIALTEGTIAGSIALNAELDQTALLVGAVVNSLREFKSSDAPEIIDIMALSTARSALTFEKLQVTLPKVLGAASALNIPFTKVVAILGRLADAGIEASIAGTSFRKILIESAKTGIDFEVALEKVRNSTEKLKTATEIFGVRAAVAAVLIVENTDRVEDLDIALQNAAGTAQQMADKELDTLIGAVTLLTSAWNGLVLSVESGDGVMGKAAVGGIRFLTTQLSRLQLLTDSNTTSWQKFQLHVNNMTRLIGAAMGTGGVFEKSIKRLEAHNKLVAEATEEIGALTEAQSKLNDETIEYNTIITGGGGGGGSTTSGAKALREELKELNEEFETINITDTKRLKIIGAKIIALKSLLKTNNSYRTALKDVNGELEKVIGLTEKLSFSQKEAKAILEGLNLKGASKIEGVEVDVSGLEPIEGESFAEKMIREGKEAEERTLKLKDAVMGVADALGISSLTVDSFFDGFKDGVFDAGEAMQSFALLAVDVINGIADAQNRKLEDRLIGLETEKEIALQFANDSAEARGEIEEQFAERRRKIQQQQFENNKEAAILSSIINTASAVVAALGTVPFTPANFILASIVGALGAAETAIIASTKVPQFERGVRDFEGGTALINEKRQEVVTTDKGVFRPRGRNMLVNLPKGANVYKSEADFNRELGGMLNDNGIDMGYGNGNGMQNIVVQGGDLTAKDVENAMKNALNGRANNVVNIDKNGISTFAVREMNKVNRLNNRVSFKGKNV